MSNKKTCSEMSVVGGCGEWEWREGEILKTRVTKIGVKNSEVPKTNSG